MANKRRLQTALKWSAGAVGFAAAAYAAYLALAWQRYGHPASSEPEDADAMLDRFMPDYDVVERHHIHVAAPAEITFAAACEANLIRSPITRALFRTRELVLGSKASAAEHPRGLLALTKSLGWRASVDTRNWESAKLPPKGLPIYVVEQRRR